MKTTTGNSGGRPTIMGARGVVAAGHALAAEAGLAILRRGGNAVDAAAAAGFAVATADPSQNGVGGEVPLLIYMAGENRVHAVSGNGTAPRAATIEAYRAMGIERIPNDGFLPALVPPMVATWVLALRRFGTMRLADVLAPAIGLADGGVPMFDHLHESIANQVGRFTREWPSSAEKFLVGGAAPPIGHLWRQPDLAATFRRLCRAEARFRRRDAGLRAAHDEFYRGPIARRIARFARATAVRDASGAAHRGLLTEEDFAAYEARIEPPASTGYRGTRVFKCGTWTQGPVLLQTLNLLEKSDLAAMGHNSADYIHTIVECMKLAFADREFYYGDPLFARVPLRRLLGKPYAAARRRLVDPERASLELRPGFAPAKRGFALAEPGDFDAIRASSVADVEKVFLGRHNKELSQNGCHVAQPPSAVQLLGQSHARGRACHSSEIVTKSGDTTSVQVIDRAGNVVSAVPSGGWLHESPVVPGVGFPLGTRGQMFSLVPGHPNSLAPGKRPRTTLTPSLAGPGGRVTLGFASPGGDCQDQWALQVFLNVCEFGMSLQEAVEAPTFWTWHFPGSFYPRTAEPGSLYVESRVPESVRSELAARGHRVKVQPAWSGGNGMAVSIDRSSGVRFAAASPRYEPAYAMGW